MCAPQSSGHSSKLVSPSIAWDALSNTSTIPAETSQSAQPVTSCRSPAHCAAEPCQSRCLLNLPSPISENLALPATTSSAAMGDGWVAKVRASAVMGVLATPVVGQDAEDVWRSEASDAKPADEAVSRDPRGRLQGTHEACSAVASSNMVISPRGPVAPWPRGPAT